MRFIVNLPKEELESVERICFQVEEAQWFYEDFIRPLDPKLPSLNLRQFCLLIFQHCPLLSGFSPYHHSTAFSEFLAYKTRVPVRGAIMLNEAMDEVVLVKGWKKNANWSFPRGKINKDEKDLDCAIREVYEETGFDIHAAELIGNEDNVKFIEVTMREQHMRLYVFRGVPMNTNFEPRTRKEISKIQWYKLSELPTLKKMKQQQQEGRVNDLAVNANKFYMVAPFLVPLRKWINQQKKLDVANPHNRNIATHGAAVSGAKAKGESEVNPAVEEPPADDMSRLVTQLRQSGKSNTVNDLAELSGPESANDASAQLKSLLNVPQPRSNNSKPIQQPSDNREEKANAMLALLRAGTKNDPQQSSQLPQTPFEQITGPPQLPPSPRHQSSRTPNVSHHHHPPPPAFPFPQSYAAQLKQSGHLTNGPMAASGPVSSKPFQQTRHIQSPAHHVLPYTVSQGDSQTLAPYQRTGDPQFAQGADHSQNLPSAIPLAKSLPLPKLNNHSSALLNIFKSVSQPTAAVSVPSVQAQATSQKPINSQRSTQPVPSKSSTHNYTENAIQPHKTESIQQPSAISQPTPNGISVAASRPRSQHQETLLNLLRTPSVSAGSQIHTSSPSLAPPTTLVELSGQPSPSHSRETSEVKVTAREHLMNGHVTIKKRPEHVLKSDQVPVSATVTGPLHFPQFDKILKRPVEKTPEGVSGFAEKSHIVPGTPAQPLSILPRPTTDDRTVLAQQVMENNKPKSLSQGNAPELLHKARDYVDQKEHAKPFHPQILRRPVDVPVTTTASPIPVPLIAPNANPTPITKDNFLLDQRTGQTQEQKSALLSLFRTPQPNLAANTPINPTLVSPLSEKLGRSDSVLPSPLDASRSRIGSLVPVMGDERQTSKPSPTDKQFLLGFLAGVAKEAV